MLLLGPIYHRHGYPALNFVKRFCLGNSPSCLCKLMNWSLHDPDLVSNVRQICPMCAMNNPIQERKLNSPTNNRLLAQMRNEKNRTRKKATKNKTKTKAGLNTGQSGPLQTTFTMTSKECKGLVPEFLSMLTSEVNTNWTFLCELSSPLPKPAFHRSDLPCRTLMTRRSSPSAEKRSCLKRVSADRLFSSSMFLSCMSESAFSKTSASFWASLYWRRDWTHRHLVQTHGNPTGCCLVQ